MTTQRRRRVYPLVLLASLCSRSASLVPSWATPKTTATARTATATQQVVNDDVIPGSKRRYINLTGFPFPLGPIFARRTVRETIAEGRAWSFEQEQNLFGLIGANTRMVVIKLRDGRFWVYNPVAPTEELLDLLREIGVTTIAHIVLGTSLYEHKIFVAPFARKFPTASIHCVPDQWSFPLNLPTALFGFRPTSREDVGPGLLNENAQYSWSGELEMRLLRPPSKLGFGYSVVEAAFVHADTKLLILTDAMVNVPLKPPAIFEHASLRKLGRDDNIVIRGAALTNWRGARSELTAAAEASSKTTADDDLRRGWQRNALLSLFFGPSPASLIAPSASFESLAEKWVVAPVCASFVFASDAIRPSVKEWVDSVAELDFHTAAPSHFAVAKCSPAQFRKAFDPVINISTDKQPPSWPSLLLMRHSKNFEGFDKSDNRLLDDIAGALRTLKII